MCNYIMLSDGIQHRYHFTYDPKFVFKLENSDMMIANLFYDEVCIGRGVNW
jgi:hypothetical protein